MSIAVTSITCYACSHNLKYRCSFFLWPRHVHLLLIFHKSIPAWCVLQPTHCDNSLPISPQVPSNYLPNSQSPGPMVEGGSHCSADTSPRPAPDTSALPACLVVQCCSPTLAVWPGSRRPWSSHTGCLQEREMTRSTTVGGASGHHYEPVEILYMSWISWMK